MTVSSQHLVSVGVSVAKLREYISTRGSRRQFGADVPVSLFTFMTVSKADVQFGFLYGRSCSV